jgi:hypothetical protein
MSWNCWSGGAGDAPILRADRVDEIVRRQAARLQLARVHPNPHAVVLRAHDVDAADALHARQLVLDVHARVVRQEQVVLLPVRRDEVHHQDDVGGLLLRRDALALDLLGQLGHRDRDAVLHEHGRHVDVGADLEGHDDLDLAVVRRALRRQVDHVVHAVDFLLEREGHGVGQHVGAGPGVVAAHRDGRRRDVRRLLDGQAEVGDAAEDHDHE